MDAFQKWLYASSLGTVVKVLLGTLLGALAAWGTDALTGSTGLAGVLGVTIQAVVPALINYLNPDDPRGGRTR